ncbi:MAG: tRNA preQ1(34) S-adenosylmethionine ribosyltransferase-isomerase QueA, partial [bacterium]|nr:tRNA preQ1(34) S-adenosylmethionine ribosyltransferase-isomerase QueA [bacterium]
LFVYDTDSDLIAFDRFFNLDKYLPKNSLLVLNDTKVVPARIVLTKETGGKVEALFLVNEWNGSGPIPALVNTKVTVGAKLFLDRGRYFIATAQDKNIFYFEPQFPAKEILPILERRGVTPIPKYIKNSGLSEKELRQKYQTVFGKKPASVAAPTASLHFTERLFNKLKKEGIKRTFVTLDVGLGTFAPVTAESIKAGKLHTEFLNIPAVSIAAIRQHKKEHYPVVAVGTTAIRAIESEAGKILSSTPARPITDATQIFIRPPYKFRIVNAIVTNFHLPGTSLLMLAQAFLENKNAKRTLIDLYNVAIKEKFRFYSFGDAMLIK